MAIKCELLIYPEHLHINQIIAGFIMLQKQGIVDLDIKIGDKRQRRLSTNNIEVVMNNKVKIAYDVMDGYTFANKSLDKYLKDLDYYFKRSYNEEDNKRYEYGYKIRKLGFNYHVSTKSNYIDKLDLDIIDTRGIRKIKDKVISKMQILRRDYKNYYPEKFEQVPIYPQDPKILFLARTWQPLECLDKEINEERITINEMRANCIRGLKNEFGNKFIGGFSNTNYTREKYRDCIANTISTIKVDFMNQVKQSDICIATLGLHKSNGWKLGEYIAASQGIISEKIYYDVPGNFKKDINYLEFNNVDNLIENTYKLYNNKDYLYKMKVNNFIYYNNYLRPDRLILNTLLQVI